jgi:hypothetical protein
MTSTPVHALEDVMCELKCMRPADGWYEGRPLCCECVELVVEREAALDVNPWLSLPELDDDAFRYD